MEVQGWVNLAKGVKGCQWGSRGIRVVKRGQWGPGCQGRLKGSRGTNKDQGGQVRSRESKGSIIPQTFGFEQAGDVFNCYLISSATATQ